MIPDISLLSVLLFELVLVRTQLRSVGLIHFAPFAGQGAVESQTQGELKAVQEGAEEGGKRGVY